MLVAISQRHTADHGGSDMLETAYTNYFNALGVRLIAIPNSVKDVSNYCKDVPIDGIILSGGGDIQPALYGGDISMPGIYTPERDDTENALISIALEQDIPVLGICRGMEFINVYFGGKIQPSANIPGGIMHDETRHQVTLKHEALVQAVGGAAAEVNSFHRMVIAKDELSHELSAFATAADQTVEGFYHPKLAIAAVIWHPEREIAAHPLNSVLVKAFLARQMFWQNRQRVPI
jgi:gamma-glutamyl-gamma-aminobutyrate hydrolase PuuD